MYKFLYFLFLSITISSFGNVFSIKKHDKFKSNKFSSVLFNYYGVDSNFKTKGLSISEIQNKQVTDSLQKQSKRQDDAINDKLQDGEGFLDNYKLQQQLLDVKTQEIKTKKRQIFIQDRYLKNQKRLIEQQQKILKSQKNELNNQGRINLLFIVIGILTLVFLGYIVKMGANRRELVRRLQQKHKEVTAKSSTLQMQNKELEQFAYIASHDLQEPLHTITSFSDFMIEDYSEKIGEEGKENLNYIKQGCIRMENLIKSLLDYSKIGSQRKLEYINSEKIVNEVLQDFKALLDETNANISISFMPVIYAYPTELRMLFQNIISNAIKFRKPDTVPEIFIEGKALEKSPEYSHRWKFKIKDNGIGIANEHQNKIFEIFKRLHTREDYEGTGIGLAHCKKVIMFHHGEIWVNSAVGQGTTFNFTIQFNPDDYEIGANRS